jgi:hypothetical protein
LQTSKNAAKRATERIKILEGAAFKWQQQVRASPGFEAVV